MPVVVSTSLTLIDSTVLIHLNSLYECPAARVFYAQTSKKLRGHIASGLSVHASVRHAYYIFRTMHAKGLKFHIWMYHQKADIYFFLSELPTFPELNPYVIWSARNLKKWGGRTVRWCWINFQCRGVLLIWITVGLGPTALAVGACGDCLPSVFSLLSPSLWETAR